MRLNKYGKCSKILNTSCLPKRPRQTSQTQIRLLLKKQGNKMTEVCWCIGAQGFQRVELVNPIPFALTTLGCGPVILRVCLLGVFV